MKVQLKVLSGSHAGKRLPLAGTQFVIGRGEDCNLRSNSDAVSRRHCVIAMKESGVSVRNLDSRNGTFVNGKQIDGDCRLRAGDELTIGPLRFQVLLGKSQSAPDTQSAVAAAAEPRPAGGKWDDDSVSQWLDEADAAERAQRLTDPDTRIFKLDETVQQDEAKSKESAKKKKTPRKKKPPAKLPAKKDNSKDSQEAAAQMLRRLFNRG